MTDHKTIRFSDALIVGFAMFATFFGAGNMIFPPSLGNESGSQWFIGFLCFILADAGLAILTVIAMVRLDGSIDAVFRHLGKRPSVIITATTMFIVGPALCIPRTCATTFEMGALPFLPKQSNVITLLAPWIFGVLFFGVVFLLTTHRTKVVDIIGKYMTPILLICLGILVIKGIITPMGPVASSTDAVAASNKGFLAGYQTMDVLGALAFTLIVIRDVRTKGYTSHRSSMRLIRWASLVTFIGLFLVYCGLCYLGAATSSLNLRDINQTALLVKITKELLGTFGQLLLAVIVLFACLTTAVGLVSSSGDYFYHLFGKKFSYRSIVAVTCIAGIFISNLGISTMIALATPMLNILYPLLLTQIILSFFTRWLRKDTIFQGAAVATLLVCLLAVAADFGAPTDFVYHLPLHNLGLYWILPAALGAVVGALIPNRK